MLGTHHKFGGCNLLTGHTQPEGKEKKYKDPHY